MAVESCTV